MAKIEIEAGRCKGCGLCVVNCPKKNIRLGKTTNQNGYFVAEQMDKSQCTGCALCAEICPDMAISVYR